MLNLFSCAYHANIGDCRGSALQRGLIEAYTGMAVKLFGYRHEWTDESVALLLDCQAIIIGEGGMLMDFNGSPIFNLDAERLGDKPLVMWSSGFNFPFNAPITGELLDKFGSLLQRCSLIGLRTTGDVSCALMCGAEQSKTFAIGSSLFMLPSELSTNKYKRVGIICNKYSLSSCLEFAHKYTDAVVTINHEGEIHPNVLSLYRDLDFAISDRFHGCVLSYNAGIPFFPLLTNMKIRNITHFCYGRDIVDFEEFLDIKESLRADIPDRLQYIRSTYANFAYRVVDLVK